jgi:hypothetical protein
VCECACACTCVCVYVSSDCVRVFVSEYVCGLQGQVI